MMQVFLTNLGKYNEGKLVGEWVSLPYTEEELEEVFERIGINEVYEEYFITDYDNDFGMKIDEFENLEELNEIAETLENLDEYEKEVIEVLLSEGYDLQESLEKKDDVIVYYNVDDMEDVAYEIVEESGMLNNAADFITRYFDYSAFGRDLMLEGCFVFANNNCYQIY